MSPTAYTASEWTDLLVASAGASAALAGLVFVAVSINIESILRYRGLPERALVTLMLLLGALVASLCALAPGQSRTALGAELLGTSLLNAVMITVLLIRSQPRGEATHLGSSLSIATLGTVFFVVGGISLLAGTGGGLYWVLGGMIGASVGAVLNAWVLLVEIRR